MGTNDSKVKIYNIEMSSGPVFGFEFYINHVSLNKLNPKLLCIAGDNLDPRLLIQNKNRS